MLFDLAKKHIAIDHHVTNENFAEIMHVEPEASSTCEVLFYLFKKEFIDDGVAASLYTDLQQIREYLDIAILPKKVL